jgi:hypothetical protein
MDEAPRLLPPNQLLRRMRANSTTDELRALDGLVRFGRMNEWSLDYTLRVALYQRFRWRVAAARADARRRKARSC